MSRGCGPASGRSGPSSHQRSGSRGRSVHRHLQRRGGRRQHRVPTSFRRTPWPVPRRPRRNRTSPWRSLTSDGSSLFGVRLNCRYGLVPRGPSGSAHHAQWPILEADGARKGTESARADSCSPEVRTFCAVIATPLFLTSRASGPEPPEVLLFPTTESGEATARGPVFVLSSALLSKLAEPVRVGGGTPARGRHRRQEALVMAKLVVTEFVSLDGVMDDPGGSEGTKHGGWTFQFDRGDEGNKFKLDELFASEALLLGRVTYQGFAQAWPGRTDEE